MKIYHGSNVIVEKPKILIPNRNLDFGAGFYCTANKKQATSFSRIVKDRSGGDEAISVYEFDRNRAINELNTKKFDLPDNEWLDFVMKHRNGIYSGEQYDIVFGPVADDRVYRTLVLFMGGDLTREETLARLQVNKLYNQIVFTSQKSLGYIAFT